MKKIALLLVAVLLSACSSKPNDELITQQVEQQLLQRYGNAVFEVHNLRKLNGISRDDNLYEAEVAYELRFVVDLKDAAAALQKQSGSIFGASAEAAALGFTYGNFRKGDTIPKQQWVKFVRSEQGWMIDQPAE